MLNFLFKFGALKMLQKLAESAEPSATDEIAGSSPVQLPPQPLVFPQVSRRAMGSLFELYLCGTDAETLRLAGEEALDEVDRVERHLSHYLPDSDVSRLNLHAAENWVRLEPRLFDLMKRCLQISHDTDGAFDITAGPLIKAWGFFRGEGRWPDETELADAIARTGYYRVEVDDEERLVHFCHSGLEINLGAVGKGYALDESARALKLYGISHWVMHGGSSSILASGDAPAGAVEDEVLSANVPECGVPHCGWPFLIKDPRNGTPLARVWLDGNALSTSGDYEQFFEHEGKRYCHIFDTVTGMPVQGMLSVSVIAPTAMESDALSTAFFVLGEDAAREYCTGRQDLRVIMLQYGEDNGIRMVRIGW